MKAFWTVLVLIFSTICHAQSNCDYGLWFLNKIDINGQVYTFNNDPIYQTIPSIDILNIQYFENLYYDPVEDDYAYDFEICLFGCTSFHAEFSNSTNQNFDITNQYLDPLPPNNNDPCDPQHQADTDLFINNFLKDPVSQAWHTTFTFNYFGDSNTPSFSNIQLTNPNGDTATFNEFIILDVDEFESNTFAIYPNPSQDVIFIKSDIQDFKLVEIYDLQGKQLLKKEYSNQNSIAVRQLEKGVYILQLTNAQGQKISRKFIKN
jgi:hypothetical protein